MNEGRSWMDIVGYTIKELRKLKLATEGPVDLAALESRFQVTFPSDAHAVASEFGKGRINDYEQFSTSRVIEETERLRASGGSRSRIVIGKLEGYLVAYEFGLA